MIRAKPRIPQWPPNFGAPELLGQELGPGLRLLACACEREGEGEGDAGSGGLSCDPGGRAAIPGD